MSVEIAHQALIQQQPINFNGFVNEHTTLTQPTIPSSSSLLLGLTNGSSNTNNGNFSSLQTGSFPTVSLDTLHLVESLQSAQPSGESLESDRSRFMAELAAFFRAIDKPLTKLPVMGYKEIDLYQLYNEIQLLGGYHQAVTQVGTWSRIWKRLSNYDPSITDSSFRLKRNYERFLLDFELHNFPEHKQRAIENGLVLNPSHHSISATNSDSGPTIKTRKQRAKLEQQLQEQQQQQQQQQQPTPHSPSDSSSHHSSFSPKKRSISQAFSDASGNTASANKRRSPLFFYDPSSQSEEEVDEFAITTLASFKTAY